MAKQQAHSECVDALWLKQHQWSVYLLAITAEQFQRILRNNIGSKSADRKEGCECVNG